VSPIRASERDRYPDDWPAIRARILVRANGRCEFTCADGRRCNAPNGSIIARMKDDKERWCSDLEAVDYLPTESYDLVRVVLTVAHLNHQPEDCRDENLKAGCQLHHLRYDAEHHRRNAAWTRRSRKRNGELFAEA